MINSNETLGHVLHHSKWGSAVEISTEYNTNIVGTIFDQVLSDLFNFYSAHFSLNQPNVISVWFKVKMSVGHNDQVGGRLVSQHHQAQGRGPVRQRLHQLGVVLHLVQDVAVAIIIIEGLRQEYRVKTDQFKLVPSVEGGQTLCHLTSLLSKLARESDIVQDWSQISLEHFLVTLLQCYDVSVVSD